MKRLLRKLNRRSGFTLTETLAVVIILLLVSGVVAAGMPVAANAYTKVVDSGNAQVLLSTSKIALREELSTATEIDPKDGKLYYRSARYGVMAELSCEDGAIWLEYLQEKDSDGKYNKRYDPSADDAEEQKKLYLRPLVSTAAATDLEVEYRSITYENGLFTVEGLTVKKDSRVLAGGTSGTFVIRVLNP